MELRVYPGEEHVAYYPLLASIAYEWLLPPAPTKAVALSSVVNIVGDYRTDDGRIINISYASRKLMLGIIGSPGYTELAAESEQTLLVKGLDLPIVTIEREPGKPATAITVMLGGVPTRAARVN